MSDVLTGEAVDVVRLTVIVAEILVADPVLGTRNARVTSLTAVRSDVLDDAAGDLILEGVVEGIGQDNRAH